MSMAEQQLQNIENDGGGGLRAEIDTSAPFESVKEAVTRFGGLGFWRPHPQNLKPSDSQLVHDVDEVDFAKVEEQAAEMEKELMLKERDTLEVLKELEATKMMVEELKSKLQRDQEECVTTQLNVFNANSEEKENNPNLSQQKLPETSSPLPSSSPGLILMELKQAKLNLTRTTSDLAEIRASVESYNKKVERERMSLEKTRERLRVNSSKVSSLEEEINRTRTKLQDGSVDDDGRDITVELQRLSAEAEQFKKMGEIAKSEVVRVMLEIEQTRAKVKTAEIRLVAAQKMKEASKAAEAVALAEIKALEKSEQNPENMITLTLEEYSSLKTKAQDAEESCNVNVLEAMLRIDEANLSKMDIMKRVEETMEEVETSKRALEKALERVEAASRAKLDVEEALRKWRSEHGERRRSSSSIQSSIKFKNPYPSHRRREIESRMLDLNGINLVNNDDVATKTAPPPVLKSTLSIGQILSRKLLITEEFESGGKNSLKRKVSLGQMLGKRNGELSSAWKVEKDGIASGSDKKLPAKKRKKFGFARFSVLLTKQQGKKKKKTTPTTRRLNFLTLGCKGEPQEVNQLAVVKTSRWNSKQGN